MLIILKERKKEQCINLYLESDIGIVDFAAESQHLLVLRSRLKSPHARKGNHV